MTRKPLSGAELNELVAGLNKLAHNLWWTWNQEAQDLFQELSPRAWQNLFHNAVAVLREVSDYELRVHLQEAGFQAHARAVLHNFEAYLNEKNTWGHKNAPELHQNPVAYFSAEFGFHESLPISAGGLGILSGDHTKSASDLGLGFVGVSLFYHEGYFQQAIDTNNWQTEFYNLIHPQNVPLEPVLNAEGERLVCSVEVNLETVTFQAWRVNVGRVPVYLLDTNLPENDEHFRNLTARVYGGDSTTRIMQEIVLGVGGVRLLRALGIQPSVFHMNEGHAAFLTLELMREKMAGGRNYADALAETKAHCIFTTHTPVEAGHDRFTPAMMDYALHGYRTTAARAVDGHPGAGPRGSAKRRRAVLHDGAGAEIVARGQRRERIARPGQPPHVAGALSGRAGGPGSHRPHHQRHPFARLDERLGAAVLAREADERRGRRNAGGHGALEQTRRG